jgi:hypothetical protein
MVDFEKGYSSKVYSIMLEKFSRRFEFSLSFLFPSDCDRRSGGNSRPKPRRKAKEFFPGIRRCPTRLEILRKEYNHPPEIQMAKRKKIHCILPFSNSPAGLFASWIRWTIATGMTAGVLAACSAAAARSSSESTHSAQTLARMITDVAIQRTSAPSSTPTSYAPPAGAATATIGPTLTPTVIATVELSTPKPRSVRATYSGSTPTTDGTSLLTRTLSPRCNAAYFIGYTAPIFENSEVKAGSTFTVTWVIRNVGVCTWYPSYYIYWHSGARMESPAYIDFPEVVPPNQNLFLSVKLVAPDEPGKYYQRWYIRDPEHVQFGIGPDYDDPLMVRIVVV